MVGSFVNLLSGSRARPHITILGRDVIWKSLQRLLGLYPVG